jgi:ketosteroid isomerase-like protein
MTAPDEAPGGAVHPNVAAYFRLIDAFNRNDLETVGTLIDANVEYTIPGRSPIACRTRGLGAHLASLKAARERSENTLRLEPLCVTAGGDRVFVYGRIRAARGDKRLDSEHYVVFRFAGGRIVEGMTLPVDQYAFDEFWS